METNNYSSAAEMPSNCRSQMDAMENSVRTEDFCIAGLSQDICGKIQEWERHLSNDLGHKISLVAYEDRSR